MSDSAAARAIGGRIGPNAITRLAEVLRPRVGEASMTTIFARAGLGNYLSHPPQRMVDEAEVARLHCAMRDTLGSGLASEMARAAGLRTADYLLAHRIPRFMQKVLKVLPATAAASVLLHAIARHAWTFAGSGRFDFSVGRATVLRLRGNPMCRGVRLTSPGCAFYSATFEGLFRELVKAEVRVTETECEACGDLACRFLVSW